MWKVSCVHIWSASDSTGQVFNKFLESSFKQAWPKDTHVRNIIFSIFYTISFYRTKNCNSVWYVTSCIKYEHVSCHFQWLTQKNLSQKLVFQKGSVLWESSYELSGTASHSWTEHFWLVNAWVSKRYIFKYDNNYEPCAKKKCTFFDELTWRVEDITWSCQLKLKASQTEKKWNRKVDTQLSPFLHDVFEAFTWTSK